jgi:hypothetical protein
MTLIVTSVIGLLVATNTNADNNVLWADGWPKEGPVQASIVVKGTITVDAGWMAPNRVLLTVWPVGGGVPKYYSANVNQLTWGETIIGGLTSGKKYHVSILGEFTKMGHVEQVLGDVRQATAK